MTKQNLVVTKGNELIQASYSLSIAETRVILLCLAKIDSRKPLALDHEFVVTVDELHTDFGSDRSNAYRDLRTAVDKLWERAILIDPDEPGSMVRWLSKKAYFRSKGEVRLSFSAQLTPYLTELRERFTSYKLKDVAKFRNSYSTRIYELLVQYKDRNERKISIGDLRIMLDLGSKYPSLTDMRRYVIDSALEDINEFSNLSVTVDQIKKGRDVTHLVFTYQNKSESCSEDEENPHEVFLEGAKEASVKKFLNEAKSMVKG